MNKDNDKKKLDYQDMILKTLGKAVSEYGPDISISSRTLAGIDKYTCCSILPGQNLKIIQFRDYLMMNGRILEEDLENQKYVAVLKSGILKMNSTLVVLMLDAENILIGALSEEGIGKQRSSKKTISSLENYIKSRIRVQK